ncbi:hypothetical protein D3C76_1413340 [compost metagenome]
MLAQGISEALYKVATALSPCEVPNDLLDDLMAGLSILEDIPDVLGNRRAGVTLYVVAHPLPFGVLFFQPANLVCCSHRSSPSLPEGAAQV